MNIALVNLKVITKMIKKRQRNTIVLIFGTAKHHRILCFNSNKIPHLIESVVNVSFANSKYAE